VTVKKRSKDASHRILHCNEQAVIYCNASFESRSL